MSTCLSKARERVLDRYPKLSSIIGRQSEGTHLIPSSRSLLAKPIEFPSSSSTQVHHQHWEKESNPLYENGNIGIMMRMMMMLKSERETQFLFFALTASQPIDSFLSLSLLLFHVHTQTICPDCIPWAKILLLIHRERPRSILTPRESRVVGL